MDLSILPDDQLLQLIEAVTKEVARRAIAIQAATNQYWQDTKEEILDNINDCQAPIDNDCTKATVISLLKKLDFFRAYKYDSFSLSIWEKNGDVRLYLQESFKTKGWKFTYYHTGNPWKFKASIEAPDLDPSGISAFRNFGRLLCDELPTKFKCFSTHDLKNQIDTLCRKISSPDALVGCCGGSTSLALGLREIAKLNPCKTILISDGEPNRRVIRIRVKQCHEPLKLLP
jgi:hypothetical protein